MNSGFWSSEKIRLRAPQKSDAKIWVEQSKLYESSRLLNGRINPPLALNVAEEFAQKNAVTNTNSSMMFFAIEDLHGELVGDINIHSIDRRNGTFESGTRIFEGFQRLGYATDAKLIVLKFAFLELRLNKYNVRCLQSNTAVIAHLKDFGCVQEGRLRSNIFLNGIYEDECLLGMTADEYSDKYQI